jgi:hypothetical protein
MALRFSLKLLNLAALASGGLFFAVANAQAPAADAPAYKPPQTQPVPSAPAAAPAPPTAPASSAPPTAPASAAPPAAGVTAPAPAAPAAASILDNDPLGLTQFAWLDGCWRGEVNQREYREHWLPLRGGMMLGASHTVIGGKTQSYEYLRLEPRADGIYYINIAMASGQSETSYKLTKREMDREDEVFTFTNTAEQFPQRILYRHNSGGWLYATVEGEIGGAAKQVIYPMHRIDCETGEGIQK